MDETARPRPSGRIKRFINGSAIVGALTALCDGFFVKLRASFFGRALSCYSAVERGFKRSGTYSIFAGARRAAGLGKKAKLAMAAAAEGSVILRGINRLAGALLHIPCRAYGTAALSFGLYSALTFLLRAYVLGDDGNFNFSYAVCGGLMAAGTLMLTVKSSLIGAVRGSVILRFVFFKFLAFNENKFIADRPHDPAKRRAMPAFLIGMALGLSSFVLPPVYLCAAGAGIAALYMLLCKPEIGMYAMILALPFLPTMVMAGFVVLVAVCYILKLIRGKRTFKFGPLDLFVAVFCVILAFGGIVSFAPAGSIRPAMLYVCMTGSYFIFANLLRQPEAIRKCCALVCLAGTAVSLIGLVQYGTGQTLTIWQDSEMFDAIAGRVVSTFGNPNVLAEYLIMCLPFAVVFLAAMRGLGRAASLASLAAAGACLVLTWSRGAWLGCIISMILLLPVINKRVGVLYVGGALCVPLLPFVLPASIVARFTSIGNTADSSTAYRVHIWQGVMNMIRDFPLSGIGVGEAPFREVYPYYSLAGIEAAPHSHNLFMQICVETGIAGLAAFLGIVVLFAQLCFMAIKAAGRGDSMRWLTGAALFSVAAALMQGMTDYIWYNYKVYLMFWIVLAVGTAAARHITENAPAGRVPEDYL